MSTENRPPSRFVQGVVVSPRIAYLLEKSVDLKPLRLRSRGEDTDLADTLHALHWAALAYDASLNGSNDTSTTEAKRPSNQALTPGAVASRLGITAHAVRLAIREQRLPATQVDGRWQISNADYQNFKAARRVA